MPMPFTPTPSTNGGTVPLSEGDPANAPRDREVSRRLDLVQELARGFTPLPMPFSFDVAAGGTSTVFTVTVSFPPYLFAQGESETAGSVQKWDAIYGVSAGLSRVEPDDPMDPAPTALAFNTWYVVYLLPREDTGEVKLTIISADAGAPNCWPWRDASRKQRYCGTFRTDGTGAPIPVHASNGRYTYSRWFASVTLAWTRGTAGRDLTVIPRLPLTARRVTLMVRHVLGSPAIGDVTEYFTIPSGFHGLVELVTDADQRLELHALGGAAEADYQVVGFEEG